MFTTELTLEQRLEKATLDLLRMDRYAAIRGALLLGTRKACPKTPTAYTDGYNEVYGEAFCGALPDRQLRGVVMHEFYHKLMQHLIVWKELFKADQKRANRAADYVVNLRVLADQAAGADVELPSCALVDSTYDGMDVWQVYQLLDPDSDEDSMDEHDHESAPDEGSADAQEQTKALDAAIREGVAYAKTQGDFADFGEVIDTNTPWREVLRDFLTAALTGNDQSTWRKPSRRYIANGMYMPSHYSESMGELVIAIDTSGSIDRATLTEAMSHVKALCEQTPPEKVRILYWDTQVQHEEVYESAAYANIAHITKPKGGGGTSAGCIPKHLSASNAKPVAVLVLTDGYVWDYGQWDCPVLWALIGDASRNFNPPVGKVVEVR